MAYLVCREALGVYYYCIFYFTIVLFFRIIASVVLVFGVSVTYLRIFFFASLVCKFANNRRVRLLTFLSVSSIYFFIIPNAFVSSSLNRVEVRQEAVQQALAQAMQNRHKLPMPSKRTSVMARSPDRDRHDSGELSK